MEGGNAMACKSQIGAQSEAGVGLPLVVDVHGGSKRILQPPPSIGRCRRRLTYLGDPRRILTVLDRPCPSTKQLLNTQV